MIDYKKLSRPLAADEIEFKVQTVYLRGDTPWAILAAYQSARTPMSIFDEAVTPPKWSLEYPSYERGDKKDTATCKIGVLTENGWVYKESNGTGEGQDKEKAAFSDALKRAAVAWGVGRVLYYFPDIFVKLEKSEIVTDKEGKFVTDSYGKIKASSKLRPQDWKWEVEYNKEGTLPTLLVAKQEQDGPNPRMNIRFKYPK